MQILSEHEGKFAASETKKGQRKREEDIKKILVLIEYHSI